jgi:precorrin-8X/cobalt-precorrin-8 methylmutase
MEPADERLPLVDRYVPSLRENARRTYELLDRALTGRFHDDDERLVARGIVELAADLDMIDLIRFAEGAVAAGVAALQAGRPLVVDDAVATQGLNLLLLERLGVGVYAGTRASGVLATVRTEPRGWHIEAMRRVQQHLDGAVVAIGWQKQALLYVLDRVDAGLARPALIVGMPWGFVNVAEAKAELMRRTVPYITITGTRGGARLAVEAVNALLLLAERNVGDGSP